MFLGIEETELRSPCRLSGDYLQRGRQPAAGVALGGHFYTDKGARQARSPAQLRPAHVAFGGGLLLVLFCAVAALLW